jgi:Flp pilus assembly pilin Flp
MLRFSKMLHDEAGQDLTEYALLAGFIAIAAVATIRLIGPLVEVLWTVIRDAIANIPVIA